MINPTTGFAVGDNGTLVKTIDGGANWLVQAVPWGTKTCSTSSSTRRTGCG